MTVTDEQVAQLRRMVDEPTETVYDDELITEFIERYPVTDERGVDPYYFVSAGSTVPVKTTNTDWIETYDLNAAAADIWLEKAAAIYDEFDFTADGGSYTRSQKYLNAMNQASAFKSRSRVKSLPATKYPAEYLPRYRDNDV